MTKAPCSCRLRGGLGLLSPRLACRLLLLVLLAEQNGAGPGDGLGPQVAPVAALRRARDDALVELAASDTRTVARAVQRLGGLVGIAGLCGEGQSLFGWNNGECL